MARLFDQVNDDLQVADSSQLTLPDGDWTISMWLYFTDNDGSDFSYFYSQGAFGASPSIQLYTAQASQASNPDEFRVNIEDSGGDIYNPTNASEHIGSDTGDWFHYYCQKDGSVCSFYYNGVFQDSDTDGGVGEIDVGSALYLGSRSDNNSARYYGGRIAEVAIWDRILTDNEKESMLAGVQPNQIPEDLHFYMPLWGRDTAEPELTANGNTGTSTGAVFADHAPMAPNLSISGGG